MNETPLPANANAGEADYAAHHIALGLPDGAPDLEPEKTLLLEAGFDELHGIAWDKGRYMGQDLTARTKHRGLVKRRRVPVAFTGPAPAPGTKVLADSQEVGDIGSCAGRLALAMLRLEALEKALDADEARLTPRMPGRIRIRLAQPTASAGRPLLRLGPSEHAQGRCLRGCQGAAVLV